MRVRWSEIASEDIRDIFYFLSIDNEAAAADAVKTIVLSTDRLVTYPNMGRPGKTKGTRELVLPPCLVVYSGRKKVEDGNPALLVRLREIVEENAAGDPMSPLKWTSKSTRTIALELTRLGHPVSSVTVGRCLEDMGYTLQANVKTREGARHPDRDAQFRYLNRRSEERRVGKECRSRWSPYH